MAEKTSNDSILERLAALETAVNRILGSGGRTQADQKVATVSEAEWQSLAKKLDEFEATLAPKEKAVLLMLLGAAAATYERAGLQESPAVGGAASTIKISGALDRVKLSDGLKSIGSFTSKAVGGFGDPGGLLKDSIGVGGDFTCVHGDWSKDLKLGAAFEDAMVRGRWNALGAANPGTLVGAGFGRSGPAAGGFG